MTSPRPRQVLPALTSFTGDRSQYSSWLVAAKLKIEVDGEAIGGERAWIATINASLDGSARNACATFVKALLRTANPVLESFYAYLDKLYDDPHAVQAAMTKWVNLRQGNQPFAAFFADFERLMYEAGASDWPAESQIERLMTGISDELADRLVGTTRPSDFNQLVGVIRNMANDLEQLRIRRKAPDQCLLKPSPNKPNGNGSGNGNSFSLNKPTHRSNMMEWEPTQGVNVHNASYRTHSPNKMGHPTGPGLPGDEQMKGCRAKWVSPDEISRRRSAGACLRCGRLRCRIALCPLASPINPNRTTIAAAGYIEPSFEERQYGRVEDASSRKQESGNGVLLG